MKTRRNPISYLTWIVYAVLALAYSYRVCTALAASFGFHRVYGIAGCILLLAVLFGVYALVRHLRSSRLEKLLDAWDLTGAKRFAKSGKNQLLATGILAAVLCIAGAVLRFLYFQKNDIRTGVWFELAKVTQVPLSGRIHAVSDWYLRLLHGFFFLFGNHAWAGVLLQALLQYLAVIACFFAVKRSAGKLAALCMTAFWMLGGFGISRIFILGPHELTFLLFAVSFLILTRCVPVRGRNPVWTILAGIFAGISVYADVTLTVLPVLALGIFWARPAGEGEEISRFVTEKQHPVPLGKRAVRFAVYLGTLLFTLVLCLAADVLLGGDPLSKVLSGIGGLYQGGPSMLEGIRLISDLTGESILLALLLLLGIPAFVFQSDRDMGSLFVLSLTLLLVLLMLGIPTAEEDGTVLLYTLLTILAGLDKAVPVLSDARKRVLLAAGKNPEQEATGEQTILEAREVPGERQNPEESAEVTPGPGEEPDREQGRGEAKKEKAKKEKPKKERPKKEKKKASRETAEEADARPLRKKVTAVVDGTEKEVELLPNPLNLPKKKDVHKMMDFDYEVPEDDDFDI
ncbi:MAG: glycosyltransferase family 39 protein [Lachnospiraceae bacterium]|nr:glycosyltransferase family 39 protein [Lachnospiraceae bacterium]